MQKVVIFLLKKNWTLISEDSEEGTKHVTEIPTSEDQDNHMAITCLPLISDLRMNLDVDLPRILEEQGDGDENIILAIEEYVCVGGP